MILKKNIYFISIAIFFSLLSSDLKADDVSNVNVTPTLSPTMVGPIVANPNPLSFQAGPLGKIYVSGSLSGLGLTQTATLTGDQSSRADLSNGQVIIQTTEGIVQFFVQAGAYSFPTLGSAYTTSSTTEKNLFGLVPVAYVKIAPSDTVSILAGKLPTLIGSEYSFSYENMNIERGLLWNQENIINNGIQGNLVFGPIALSAALTNGFYSNKLNWLTGSITYTVDTENSLSFQAGGPLSKNTYNSSATNNIYNNSSIYDIAYTYNSAPWLVSPYIQYTSVPQYKAIGVTKSSSTTSFALLTSYSFENEKLAGVSLPARIEYISTDGSLAGGSPNLLFGPGSKAWSFTVTPTYQKDIFFTRFEASYVLADSFTRGNGFGKSGNSSTQTRFLIETGILF
jgi:hypothetical protein